MKEYVSEKSWEVKETVITMDRIQVQGRKRGEAERERESAGEDTEEA